jgi:hypothetical protein
MLFNMYLHAYSYAYCTCSCESVAALKAMLLLLSRSLQQHMCIMWCSLVVHEGQERRRSCSWTTS